MLAAVRAAFTLALLASVAGALLNSVDAPFLERAPPFAVSRFTFGKAVHRPLPDLKVQLIDAACHLDATRMARALRLQADQEASSDPRPKSTGSSAVLKLLVRRNRDAKKSGHVCLGQSTSFARCAQASTHFLDGLRYVFSLGETFRHRSHESTTFGLQRREHSKCICYCNMRQSTTNCHRLNANAC
ncbi:hypothetical protein [Variovorax sp. SRS16]|uniref:hypothetical protein n=1 Tax=Variovorax sp. SRS16 TaxID=282217 RepID=UPI001E532DE3|nr:hypothetical protein [Variovorax sp. SRS16]